MGNPVSPAAGPGFFFWPFCLRRDRAAREHSGLPGGGGAQPVGHVSRISPSLQAAGVVMFRAW